jgi:uracil-DNA glycosylase
VLFREADVEVPPSLQNIYKELHDDLGCAIPNHGYLVKWAQQGVLLLNAVLTVRAHRAGSHRPLGWEQFTDHIIALLNERTDPVVFILWGSFAQSKGPLITNPIIITSSNPRTVPAFGLPRFFRQQTVFESEHLPRIGRENTD